MPRLTDKEKAEVITDFTAGKNKSDIAKKFNISITAVSKILKNVKSLENVKKLSKSSAELRKEIIDKATVSLYNKNFDSLPPETLIKVIERLSLLEDERTTDNNNKAVVEFVFKDTAIKDDEPENNNTENI